MRIKAVNKRNVKFVPNYSSLQACAIITVSINKWSFNRINNRAQHRYHWLNPWSRFSCGFFFYLIAFDVVDVCFKLFSLSVGAHALHESVRSAYQRSTVHLVIDADNVISWQSAVRSAEIRRAFATPFWRWFHAEFEVSARMFIVFHPLSRFHATRIRI